MLLGVIFASMKAKTPKIKKKAKTDSGKNIRFSSRAHEIISNHVKMNGYKLSAFCEMAALQKIADEAISEL